MLKSLAGSQHASQARHVRTVDISGGTTGQPIRSLPADLSPTPRGRWPPYGTCLQRAMGEEEPQGAHWLQHPNARAVFRRRCVFKIPSRVTTPSQARHVHTADRSDDATGQPKESPCGPISHTPREVAALRHLPPTGQGRGRAAGGPLVAPSETPARCTARTQAA